MPDAQDDEAVMRLVDLAMSQPLDARQAWLQTACAGNVDLFRVVWDYVQWKHSMRDFLLQPIHSPASETLAAGDRLGSYEILAPVGAGGMGEVYRARDTKLSRQVAIKVLPRHLADDPSARLRLRREANAAAALDHPFICKVFEFGEVREVLFLAMEFIDGETLQQRLGSASLPLPEALRFAGEVAEALEEAHTHRFVHRDLKPANVMVAQGHVKIMDFGLAKPLAPLYCGGESTDAVPGAAGTFTEPGRVIGTPEYMSPEQLRGEPLDQRSDLFSFGILLCELVSIPHPFRRDSPTETIAAVLRDPPVLTGDLPQGLMLLIRRLLAKAPEDRYQSMTEVRADLARLPVTAPAPEPPKEREGRIPLRIPLIGREAEWKELMRHLQEALDGRGSVVMIGGEPGIGKTHLITALLEEARRRGAYTNIGHCYEMEGAPPYVPFVEMLERTARVAPKEGFRLALGEAAPEIAKLMPELRRMYPDIPPAIQLPPEQQRRFLFNSIREFMERAAKVTPMVHVFEDLHWADEPTLHLLVHVAQSVKSIPMLLVGTYRDVELDVGRPFAGTLEILGRQKLGARIALRRLPAAGVEAMLGAMSGQVPPPPLARTIFAGTEGNPFFVAEVFRHLAEEGKLFDESGHWIPDLRVDRLEVPEGVRLVIGKRLQRLSPETRRVLTTAAVIGRSFSLTLVEALESARPDAALDAVEEAERAHVVTAAGSGRDPCYSFVHELIRQTLAEGLSLPRRQRLHARIAGMMERVFAPALDKHTQAIAHHLYQAGTAAEPEKTLQYLLRAADIARRSAGHESALANLDAAVLLLDGVSGVAMADLEERRALVLQGLGRRPEAVVAYESAIAGFLAAAEPVRAAAASLPVMWIQGWSGRFDRAISAGQRALHLLGDRDPEVRARVLSVMAPAMSSLGRIAESLRTIAEVDALGVSHPESLMAQSHAFLHAGQLRRAIEANERAFRMVQPSGNSWFTVDAEAFGLYLRSYAGPVEGREAEQTLKRAIAQGHQFAVWSSRISLDRAALLRGEFRSAAQSMQESIALAESQQVYWRFWDYLGLAALHDGVDEDAAMEESFQRAIGCELPNPSTGSSVAYLFRARAARGDASALDLLRDPGVSMPVPGQPNRLGAYTAAVCAAEGLAALGRTAESGALLPAVEQFLAGGGEYTWVRSTRTAAGIAAACAREWSRAEEHHRAAIHHADTAPARIFQPVSREWYAAMLAGRGDLDRARLTLAEALALYEAIGMPGYARRASERLAAMAR